MGIIGAVFVIAAASLGLWLSDGMPSDLTLTNLTNTLFHREVAAAPMPDLNRPLTFSADFPAEARPMVEQKVKELTDLINADPQGSIAPWLDLAIEYKMIGDYEGAEHVWAYLVDAYPGDAVAAHNLGNLYHLFMKDYPKAEEYYKVAIQRAPTHAIHYIGLHELYKYSYKQDTSAAADTLKEALQKVPGDADLSMTLGMYYKEKGSNEEAITYLTQARDEAKKLGNATFATQMDTEIKSLQK